MQKASNECNHGCSAARDGQGLTDPSFAAVKEQTVQEGSSFGRKEIEDSGVGGLEKFVAAPPYLASLKSIMPLPRDFCLFEA